MRIKSDYLPFIFIFIICILMISLVNYFDGRVKEGTDVSVNSNQADKTRIDWYVPKAVKNQRPIFPNDVNTYIEKYNTYIMGAEEKEAYLTFNCGYEYNNYTVEVLNILKEQNVKGAFFITGDYLRDNTDIVRRMVDEGHIVGNHGNRHADISALTSSEIKKEIEDFEHSYKRLNFSDQHQVHLQKKA